MSALQWPWRSEELRRFMSEIPIEDLGRIRNAANNEAYRRTFELCNLREGWIAFASFMSCVSHALLLRTLLRWSKDHKAIGSNLASGEMWLPHEIALAATKVDRWMHDHNIYIYNPFINTCPPHVTSGREYAKIYSNKKPEYDVAGEQLSFAFKY